MCFFLQPRSCHKPWCPPHFPFDGLWESVFMCVSGRPVSEVELQSSDPGRERRRSEWKNPRRNAASHGCTRTTTVLTKTLESFGLRGDLTESRTPSGREGGIKERAPWLNKILIARNRTHPASLKFKHLFGVCEVYTSHKLFRFVSLWRAAGQRATPAEFPNHWQRQQPSGLAPPTAAIMSRQVSRSRSAVLLLLLFTLLLLLLLSGAQQAALDFTMFY